MFAPVLPEDRTQFLDRAFEKEFKFTHRGQKLLYRPTGRHELLVGAVIGRENPETIREEETDFVPYSVEDWDFSNVVLDLEQSAQIAYVQSNRVVGRPFSIFKSICSHLNRRSLEHWDIVPHTMPSSEEFMSVAHQHKGRIVEIEFVFAVPNIIYTISDELNKALTTWRDEANAQEVVTAIRNAEGQINPDNDEIREGARAVSEGVATSRIRIGGGRQVYNSENMRKL
jgi:hypothetical protein